MSVFSVSYFIYASDLSIRQIVSVILNLRLKNLVFGREVRTQVVEIEIETGQSDSKASEPLTIRMYLCIFIFICSIKDLNYYGQMYCRH